MKIVIKKHDILTSYARIIFGGILEGVYVYSGSYDNPHVEEDLDEEMTEVYTEMRQEGCFTEINTDIILRFVNGNNVFLSGEDVINMFSRIDAEFTELK